MKWLTIAGVLLYLSRHSEAGALKCSPESQEPRCAENRDISSVQILDGVKETASGDTQCLAGSEWESNCHYCRCSDSGVAECLKGEACGIGVFAEPIKCKPNTTFERDCNICTCLENGLGLCTLRDCQLERKRQTNCEQGSTWKNDCNICRCLENGRFVCTKKGCLHLPPSKNLQKRDVEIETSKLNSTLNRKTRAAQEPPKTCQPGQEFRMDCNKCLCNDEGHDFSCTRIDCTAQNNNGGVDTFAGARTKRELTEQVSTECNPGSVFDRECNVCRCTEDGKHATCTLKPCKKQETESTTTESAVSFRCTPGDQFKRDCNDCTCSADGKSVFCTLRICDMN